VLEKKSLANSKYIMLGQ